MGVGSGAGPDGFFDQLDLKRVAIVAGAQADGTGKIEGVGEGFGVRRASLELGSEPVGQRVAIAEVLRVRSQVNEGVEHREGVVAVGLNAKAPAPEADPEEGLGDGVALGAVALAKDFVEDALGGFAGEQINERGAQIDASEGAEVDRADAFAGGSHDPFTLSEGEAGVEGAGRKKAAPRFLRARASSN